MSNAEFYTATGLHSRLTSYVRQRKTSFQFGGEKSLKKLSTVSRLQNLLEASNKYTLVQLCHWVVRNQDALKDILPGKDSPFQKLKADTLETIAWCTEQAAKSRLPVTFKTH